MPAPKKEKPTIINPSGRKLVNAVRDIQVDTKNIYDQFDEFVLDLDDT